MRKLLIFTTIVLIFAFATQEKVHNKTKTNKTKTFNTSRLFNRTKVCEPGQFFNFTSKKCQKVNKTLFNELVKKFNKTKCTTGSKLSCRDHKFGNKTLKFCKCKPVFVKPSKPINKTHVCPQGYSYKCSNSFFGKRLCSCKKDKILPIQEYKCPAGKSLSCKKGLFGVKDCECI